MGASRIYPLFKILILSFVITAGPASAEVFRTRPAAVDVKCIPVEFNGEPVNAQYSIVDARTAEERDADMKRGRPAGDVIIFFHGHAQRPDSGSGLITELAVKSRSGLIVTPVCDTPYGKEEKWRGDAGKIVILMEVARYALDRIGISIEGYSPATDMKILLDGKESQPALQAPDKISVRILALGYSHGAILSRRFANSYPAAVDNLVQICPAGYTDWGGGGTCCLISNFALETVNLSLRIFSHPRAVAGSSWAVTKGISGDLFRSCPSCLNGNRNFFKLLRPLRDAKECTLRVDDRNYPVARIKNIAVFFASDDLLFDADEILGVDDPAKITLQDEERFWSKYYPEEVLGGTKFTFRMLPGTHNGPIEHYIQYAGAALTAAGEQR